VAVFHFHLLGIIPNVLVGDGSLPEKSGVFMIAFAVFFGLVSASKFYAAHRNLWWVKYIPSGVAFAIGFLNTPSFSLARLIGGIMEYIFRTRISAKRKDGGSDIRLIVIASGFVLGEGVTSVISLVLRTCGVGVISCAGCSLTGMCAGGCA
jgi:uncharacterized oligopeptide transporter (OPT) family protein